MSATLSRKYLMARGVSAFLHYLHLDLTMTGLVLLILFAGGIANQFEVVRSIGAVVPNFSIPAAGAAPLRVADSATQPLTPAMRAALDSVVQRYRVSAEALQPVFGAVQSVARERNLDPLLLIAVISIESRFNPFSQSSMGAQGLMQIIPRYHQEKIPQAAGETPFLDPVTNVRIGAHILQEAIRRQGGLVEGLQYYAGAADDEEKVYANKVLAEKLRLEQAARRRDGATA